MNWRNWPLGEQGHNVHSDALDCPVCFHHLRSVNLSNKLRDSELWDCVCINCKTRYIVRVPTGRIEQPQEVDPTNERLRLAETRIAALESVIAQLTQEVASLKRERRQPPKTETLDSSDSLDSNDSLKSKYRHLL